VSVRSIVIFSGSSHVSDSSALASNSLLLEYSFFGIEISVVTRAGRKNLDEILYDYWLAIWWYIGGGVRGK